MSAPATPAGRLWLLAVLSLLLGFASISTDLYLPALPTMAAELGAGKGALQWTISGYLAGFAFGQLFWGPLSDRYGRRGPVLTGVLVFAVGSGGCALSTAPWQIIGWRLVQALGASAGVALARAMVRDLYERDEAARLLSTLMTVMAVAPLVGPIAGAQILAQASWQAIFWTLVAIGLLTAAAIPTLPKTLPAGARVSGVAFLLRRIDAFRQQAARRVARGPRILQADVWVCPEGEFLLDPAFRAKLDPPQTTACRRDLRIQPLSV